MALLTPPPTANRLGHDHLQPGTNRLAYYEDYYGVVNPDENLEGQPELCESETDSDDGLVPETGDNDGRDTGKRDGFFKKYTEREWKGLAAAGLASPPNGHGEINGNGIFSSLPELFYSRDLPTSLLLTHNWIQSRTCSITSTFRTAHHRILPNLTFQHHPNTTSLRLIVTRSGHLARSDFRSRSLSLRHARHQRSSHQESSVSSAS